MVKNKALRLLLSLLGIICVIIGTIGIILPILPTTPFVLLAGLLFSFSNEKLGAALERSKLLGPYLGHYKSGKGVPKKVKIKALVMLWFGLGLTFYLVGTPSLIVMLSIIGSAVSIHIITIKPRKNSKQLVA